MSINYIVHISLLLLRRYVNLCPAKLPPVPTIYTSFQATCISDSGADHSEQKFTVNAHLFL